MRPGRAAVHTALPLVALMALAGLSAVQPAPSAGAAQAAIVAVAGRIVTDGQPVLLHPPRARRARPVKTSAPRPVIGRAAPVARRTPGVLHATPAPARVVVADRYPYASEAGNDPDPWGFTRRQCVSYVAWRLAEAGRPLDNGRDGWGSALDWDDTARRLGRPVSSRPSVGAVAHWNAGEHSAYWSPGSSRANGMFAAGDLGHVAWVTAVYGDGSVQVAQYNGTGDRSFSTMRVKAPRYVLP